MSSYKAIGAVSASLKALLEDRMEASIDVTIAPPDVVLPGRTARINLYLYRITENAALKNQEIPGHGHPASYGHPPLSLNLHYLVTAYPGNEKTDDADRKAQEALGDAMRVLHDYAILTPDLLDKDPPHKRLLDPILRDAFERVKITLEPMSLDDLSRIWTAMPQANFRRSVSYEVSVVQIESRIPRRAVKPVEKRRIQVAAPQRPEITAVYRKPVPPEKPGDPRTKIGDTIVIKGQGFLSPATRVRLGELAPVAVNPPDDATIEILVPDDPLLQPGAQEVEVQVQREVEGVQGGLSDRGDPYTGQVFVESNRSFFLLVPEIVSLSPVLGPAATTTVTVTGVRLFKSDLQSYLLVGDVAIPVPQPAGPDPSIKIQVPLKPLGAATGLRPVRIVVNGAQNLETGFNFTLT